MLKRTLWVAVAFMAVLAMSVSIVASQGVGVTIPQAEEIATTALGGGTVTGTSIGFFDTLRVHHVDVAIDGMHRRITVDAADGSILHHSILRDATPAAGWHSHNIHRSGHKSHSRSRHH